MATLSHIQGTVALIKCAIGAGSFTLPFAFMQGGLWAAVVFTILLGLLTIFTFFLLIKSYEIAISTLINKNESQRNILQYSCLGKIAFPSASVSVNGFEFNVMELIISFGVFLTCIGVSASYVDFVIETAPGLCHAYFNSCDVVSPKTLPWVILFILAFLSCLNVRSLSFTSILGDIAVFGGCLTVILCGISHEHIDLHDIRNIATTSIFHSSTIYSYFGCTSFLYSIHVAALPILSRLNDPDQKLSVIWQGFSVVIISNVSFGIIGYLLYARSTCSVTNLSGDVHTYLGPCANILSNIPSGDVANIAKFFICVDLIFTVPLVLNAANELVDSSFNPVLINLLEKVWYYEQVSTSTAHGNECDIDLVITTTNNPVIEMNLTQPICEEEDPNTTQQCQKRNNFCATELGESYNKTSTTTTNERLVHAIKIIVHILIVCVVISIAILVPNFGDLISLVGGIACSLTGYIIPPLIYLSISNEQRNSFSTPYVVALYSIAVFGVACMITSIIFFARQT